MKQAETKTTPIDHEYYEWLIAQIKVGNPNKSYLGLFELMHNTEFIWFIPNDDNRVEDGRHLRTDFFRFEKGRRYRKNDLVIDGVSALEVLVALSRRVAFQAGGDPDYWAWRLIKNLKLNRMSDPLSENQIEKIKEILEIVIWRTYERDGQGGFFPLKRNFDDQAATEIWYQMNAYILEIQGMK